VRTQLYGHVHQELYNPVIARESRKPVGIEHWSGSMTSHWENNPSFRVYELDESTLVPVSAHTYFFDIKEPEKGFQHLYEMKEEFEVKNLSPSALYQVGERLQKDKEFAVEISNIMYRRRDREVFPTVDQLRMDELRSTVQTGSLIEGVAARPGLPFEAYAEDYGLELLAGPYYDVDPSSQIAEMRNKEEKS